MVNIYIPKKNIIEREYIINVFFNEFLDLDYELHSHQNENYIIKLENNSELIIKDDFFFKHSEKLEYLNLDNLPKNIIFAENEFLIESDIPVLYGDSLVIKKENKIYCGIDLFASSFFMLTRWEEYVNKNKDSHNRFPAHESVAFKNNFLDRPIVNEYLEMLWNMLSDLKINQIRKQRKFKFYPTHDVDIPLKYPNLNSGLREILGDLIKRKNINLFYKNLKQKVKVHLNFEKDPYDTFDYLMRISEKGNIKSYFFFMGSGLTKFDNFYSINSDFIKKLTIKIKKRGHFIGMHPTYNAYNHNSQFKKEKEELEQSLNCKLYYGREHYLRFEVPNTWQIWEDNGMEWDSTLCYADNAGFRSGVCYEYSVFNFLTRKKLKLKEKPLIAMEVSFIIYKPNIEAIEMENQVLYLLEKVKKYNGDFVFLWHNNNFKANLWKRYKYIYEKIILLE